MNTIYRIVWSAVTGRWVVASELAKSRGKSGSSKQAAVSTVLLAGILGGLSGVAQASEVGTTYLNFTYAPNAFMSSVIKEGFDPLLVNKMNDPIYSDSLSIGITATANATRGLAVGDQASVLLGATGGTALGSSATAGGVGATAIGAGANSFGLNSTALGTGAFTNNLATNSMALGYNATTMASNSVALGASSATDRANTVSVGSAVNIDTLTGVPIVPQTRQIVNMAAGTQATDAVNVSQLTPVVTALGGGAAIDPTTGVVTGPTYTLPNANTISGMTGSLGDVGTALGRIDTALGNVVTKRYFKMQGDAVPGPDAIATGYSSVAMGSGTYANNLATALGSNAKATADAAVAIGYNSAATDRSATAIGAASLAEASRSVAIGVMSTVDAGATESVAIGRWAHATVANSVALGAWSTTTADLTLSAYNPGSAALSGMASTANGEVSIGKSGSERRLTNLAAGSALTDAVNVSQLIAQDATVDLLGANTAAALGGGATYDATTGAITAPSYVLANANTIGGTSGAATDVGNGFVKVDAALGVINTNLDTVTTTVNNITNGGGIKYFHTNSSLADSQAIGTDSVAIGGLTQARAANSVALGTGAFTSNLAPNSTALGYNATTMASNSVALGAGSATDRANTVSVGSAVNVDTLTGIEVVPQTRQIVNMAAGTQDTDAVNVSQLKPLVTALGGGAGFDPATGIVTGPSYALPKANLITGATGPYSTVGSALTNIDNALDKVNTTATNTNRYFKAKGANNGTDDALNGGDLAIGANSKSATVNDIAIGYGAVADSIGGSNPTNSAMAIGYNAQATNYGAMAIGAGAQATGAGGLAFGRYASAQGNASLALGNRNTALGTNSVSLGSYSLADRDNTVSVGAATSFTDIGGNPRSPMTRQIVNMGAGTEDTDAVNVSQLKPLVNALGGGATFDSTTGLVTGPSYAVTNIDGSTTTVSNVGDAIANLDGRTVTNTTNITNLDARVTTNEGNINTINTSINNGTIGPVQRTGTDQLSLIALGGEATTPGAAQGLTNLANGAVNAMSVDAVNGSQLFGVSQSAADALGGGSTVNADGTIAAPSYTVTNIDGSTTTVNNVGDAITNLDDRTTTNTTNIAGNTTAINNITNQINSGTVGLVQQAAAGANLTVGKDTDGAAVDFTGTAGERKLIGVADGTVGSGSKEAVNGGQLFGVSQSVANAMGGGSTVNADGSISAPSYTLTNIDGSTSTVNNVGDAITNLDGRTTTNTTNIAGNTTAINNITNQINNGTIGLVQQAAAGENLTVGKDTDGAAVDFAGTAGARKLINVADGTVATGSKDAVNGGQLFGVSQSAADALGGGSTVNSDGTISAPTYVIHNYDGSTTTINNVGGAITNLDSRVVQNTTDITNLTNIVNNGGSAGMFRASSDYSSIAPVASGTRSVAGGNNAVASGDNSMAVGNDAQATASNAVALGNGAISSGSNASAMGSNARATGSNSTAVGSNAVSSAANSVALGANSVADRESSVSVGSAGSERQIVNVAAGTNVTDAVNLGQLAAVAGLVVNNNGTVTNPTFIINHGGDSSTTYNNIAGAVTDLSSNVSNINNGAAGMFQVSQDYNQPAPKPTGAKSTAGGAGAVAAGANSTALGADAKATANNSVAVGANSVADRDDSVSVGSAGNERQVTNVAAGSKATDAVNVSQLVDIGNAAIGRANAYTDYRFEQVRREARAGTAAAMAMANLPQSNIAGRGMMSIATSSFGGQSAAALGMSHTSDSGRWVFKASASADTRSNYGVAVGAGFHW